MVLVNLGVSALPSVSKTDPFFGRTLPSVDPQKWCVSSFVIWDRFVITLAIKLILFWLAGSAIGSGDCLKRKTYGRTLDSEIIIVCSFQSDPSRYHKN